MRAVISRAVITRALISRAVITPGTTGEVTGGTDRDLQTLAERVVWRVY